MISSTTLLLATLVFNAVSSLGAPVRIPVVESDVVARAEISEPVLRRSEFVEIVPQHKRSNLGEFTRRSVRLPRKADTEIEARDTASPSVDARDALPEIETVVRRYPRVHLYNFYEKRSPAPGDVSDEPQVERRFPRQALHARFVKRQEEETPAKGEGATTPAGSEDPAASPSASASDASASPSASATATDATASPSATATDATASPSDATATPSATTTTAKGDSSATATPSPSSTDSSSSATPTTSSASSTKPASATSTSTGTTPAPTESKGAAETPVKPTAAASSSSSSAAVPVATSKADQPTDVAAIIASLEKNTGNGGFQNGQTIKETTVIVNKVTYNSDPKNPVVVSATTTTVAQPAATASSSSTATPADGSKPPSEAAPSPSATSTSTEAAAAEASPSAEPAEAEPRSFFRREIGYSGAAFASLLKRSLDLD